MRMLFIHSDHVAFEAKKPALKSPPQLTPSEASGRMEEALVVFYSVEAGDDADPDALAQKALENVQDILRQVKAPRVMLYPYAHLSGNLAKPAVAADVGKRILAATKAAGIEVGAAPFGWYKAFEIKAKGHPLAELARTVTVTPGAAPASPVHRKEEGAVSPLHASEHAHGPSGFELRSAAQPQPSASAPQGSAGESEALQKEKKLKSHWYFLTPDDELVPVKDFDLSKWPALAAFRKHEMEGTRAVGNEEPAHVRLMREMELVDYEPGSDPGNFRWYPKGQLVKRLLETHVSDLVAEAGGMRVETPIMYDYEHPALSKYLNRFPARQYILKSEDKEFFLRFAACFGQYLIGHDMTISHKHLPIRLYELTHYSFRREQRGELSGLRRLRTFTMPDMHTLTGDVDAAKEEFTRQFRLSMQWMNDLGVPYEAGVRFVRSFFDENRAFAVNLAKILGRPMLVEIWDERFFYFVTKFEFNVLDTQGKAAALSTVQIDVENGERFDINYVDETGQKRHPLILHTSISGSIDRNVYALLENEARKMQAGQKATLPFWLSPTQVRLIAVNDTHRDACVKMAEELTRAGFRADVDDRGEGVGRKIRDAETEWVPFVMTFGDKEAQREGMFPIRVRASGEVKDFTMEQLIATCRQLKGNRPTARLPLPMRMSQRPVFRG